MKKQPLYLLVVIPVLACFAAILIISLLFGDGRSDKMEDEPKITIGNVENQTTPELPDTNFTDFPPITSVTTEPAIDTEDVTSDTSNTNSLVYLDFSLLGDGTYEVKLKEKKARIEHIEIPKEYKEIAVTKVASDGFKGGNVVSVTIPESVKTIGDNAFYECSRLSIVNLTQGLESIGDCAFYKTAIKDLVIPDTVVSIGQNAFFGCVSLAKVKLPKNMKTILQGTFSGCTKLENIEIPKYVENIYSSAFFECSSLESITINNSGITIGEQAFFSCTSLVSLVINSSDTKILSKAFENCTSLEMLFIENGKISIGESAFSGCTSLIVASLGDGEISLGNSVFENCVNMKLMLIGEGLTDIGSYAFKNCRLLSKIEVKNTINRIGSYAFSGCASLTDINIPTNLTNINEGTFANCVALKSITIPDNIKVIQKDAFRGCSGLEELYIPETVVNIGENAFSECTSLESITLPFVGQTNTKHESSYLGWLFESNATEYKLNNNLKTVTVTGGNVYSYSFKGFSLLQNIIIEDGVGYVEVGAFESCTSLESLTLPSMELDGRDLTINQFFGAYKYAPKSLKNVTINNGIIGTNAFYEVSSIEKITLGKGVTLVKNSAFLRCTALKELTVLNNDFEGFYLAAFSQCSNLTDLYFDGTKEEWNSIKKHEFWDADTEKYTVHCSDGDITKSN